MILLISDLLLVDFKIVVVALPLPTSLEFCFLAFALIGYNNFHPVSWTALLPINIITFLLLN